MNGPNELEELRLRAREDRKLFQKAADALAEIDRNQGLDDHHADVLAALRIRVEGKKRASLDELISATGEIAGKRDLGDVLGSSGPKKTSEWPEVEENKKDWPGL
ncbi:MAG: hypothetical protein ACRDJ2_01200 [Actinomycetota bacterium]